MCIRDSLIADQHRCCAVHNARGVARVVYMVNTLHLRIAGERHRIKPQGAHLLKRGFQARQPLQRGVGLDEFITTQNGLCLLYTSRCV